MAGGSTNLPTQADWQEPQCLGTNRPFYPMVVYRVAGYHLLFICGLNSQSTALILTGSIAVVKIVDTLRANRIQKLESSGRSKAKLPCSATAEEFASGAEHRTTTHLKSQRDCSLQASPLL